jgi:hypothetical protein
MTRTRRMGALVAMLLVLALAVPASAATWRTIGTATAQGLASEYESSYSSMWVGARDVADVQVGFKVYGSTRRVEYDYSVWCYDNGNSSSKSRTGLTRSVAPGGWRWVTVWSRASKAVCDVDVSTNLDNYGYGTVRTRVRVR